MAENVIFDRAGFWTVTITADVKGRGTLTTVSTFTLHWKHHTVPLVAFPSVKEDISAAGEAFAQLPVEIPATSL